MANEVKEKRMKEIDMDNPTKEDVQSLVYRYMRNARDGEDNEMVAKIFSDYVNSMGHNGKELVREMMKDHRTLLQSKMNIVFLMIAAAAKAKKDRYVDGRNEYSFGIAAEIYKRMSCEYKLDFTKKILAKTKCGKKTVEKILEGIKGDKCYKEDRDCENCKYHKLWLGTPLI